MSEFKKDWTVRIIHMIQAGEEIQTYTQDLSMEEFVADLKTIRSVERCFMILGEAANKIPKDIQNKFSVIEWSDIIGFRHIIAHDYDRTRDVIIWSAIQNKLPALLKNLKDIKNTMEKE